MSREAAADSTFVTLLSQLYGDCVPLGQREWHRQPCLARNGVNLAGHGLAGDMHGADLAVLNGDGSEPHLAAEDRDVCRVRGVADLAPSGAGQQRVTLCAAGEAQALRAAKRALDPQAMLNPGVLIEP